MLLAKGFSMEKWLCWGSMGVAGLLLIVFILDFFMSVPFGRISPAVDVISIIASGLVLYMAWDAYRDVR